MSKNTVAELVNQIDGPINVVMGLSGSNVSMDELAEMGVRRVSVGGSGPDFKVIELIPYELVRWQHSGVMPKDWMDTDIVFRLDQDGEQTLVHFTHGNWCEASSFMAHCSMKWAVFLLSLKDVVETGKGKPYPDDVHIDHY